MPVTVKDIAAFETLCTLVDTRFGDDCYLTAADGDIKVHRLDVNYDSATMDEVADLSWTVLSDARLAEFDTCRAQLDATSERRSELFRTPGLNAFNSGDTATLHEVRRCRAEVERARSNVQRDAASARLAAARSVRRTFLNDHREMRDTFRAAEAASKALDAEVHSLWSKMRTLADSVVSDHRTDGAGR